MRNIVLLFLLLASCFSMAQRAIVYSKPVDPALQFRQLSKQEFAADISFWQQVMEESHVNLYHAISKEQLQELANSLLTKVKDSISHTGALLAFGKLSAALDEGHIGLPVSAATDSLYVQSLRFPFLLQKVEPEAWLVNRELSTEVHLHTNDRIIAINGKSITEWNKEFATYYGGLETWRLQQINANMRKLLFFHGVRSPYRIDAQTETGKKISFTIDGYNRQQADSINRALAASQPKPKAPYEFEILPEQIGYLNYRSMVNNKEEPFSVFLEKSFSQLIKAGAKGLVVDLRENGGGDSSFGDSLVSYFSSKPYRFASGMKWKISEHYKEYIRLVSANKNDDGDNKFYTSQKNGTMYTWKSDKLRKPAKKENKFSGPVAFLIGPNTFSSANMLADGVKAYQLATVFGEPTGESGNDFGEMYNFMLPNSHIIARASTKMFTRADGNETDFSPVQPDFLIKPTAEDFRQKKDPVLQGAINWILKK